MPEEERLLEIATGKIVVYISGNTLVSENMNPSRFQIDCLLFVLRSDKSFARLLEQIPHLQVESVEHTGVGCIYNYKLDNYTLVTDEYPKVDFIIGGGFHLEADALPYGASIDIWIQKGFIDALEILAHGSNFPTTDPKTYSFKILPINIIEDKNGT